MRPARHGLLALVAVLALGSPVAAHADRTGAPTAGSSASGTPSGTSSGTYTGGSSVIGSSVTMSSMSGTSATGAGAEAAPRPKPAPSAGRSPWGPWPAAKPGRARVVRENWLGLRMVDLHISSPSVNATLPVRLLLPNGWTKDADRTWPVLYLLHGGADDYTAWTRMTDIAAMTENMDAIIVMPEAGRAGNYSNWYNNGKRGAPAWETFHTSEVRRLLETGYRAGSRRAVAGLSMGAYGAVKYAARHRGMFRFAGAYSGVMSTRLPGIPELIMNAQAAEGHDPKALWGDPIRNRSVWRANDPVHHARNLRGVRVYISSGTTSRLGELDPPGVPWSPAHLGEPISAYTARHLIAKLRLYGVRPVVHLYRNGTHTWPYWKREFDRSFPMILSALGLEGTAATGEETAAASRQGRDQDRDQDRGQGRDQDRGQGRDGGSRNLLGGN